MPEKPNELARIINDTNGSLACDSRAKILFSLRPVIARIAQACVPELRNLPCKLIADECLESFKDSSDGFRSQFAKVLSTQRPLPNGGNMDCDLMFEIHPPKSLHLNWKPQLLNIEIQNDCRKLERCIGRGMLYATGLYYMEYGAIFTYPKYEDAWRVHSIWICPSAPSKFQGMIMDFQMTGVCHPMSSKWRQIQCCQYDKLHMTFVNTGGNNGRGRKDLLGFIWTLTTPTLSAEERKKILKEDFEMEMTQEVSNAVDAYDGWVVDFIGRDRYAKDMKKAELKGKREGKREGEQKTKEKIVLNLLGMKYSLDVISKITSMDQADIIKIAKDNNLLFA